MLRIIESLRGLFLKFGKHSTGAYAAQLSYFTILSFIPFVMILAAGITLTPLKEDYLRDVLYHALPPDFYAVVLPIIRDIFARSGSVLPFSIVIALWSSGKVISSLTTALNIIYQVKESKGYLVNRLRGTLYTFIVIISIFFIMLLMIFGSILQAFLLNMNAELNGIMAVFGILTKNTNTISWFVLILLFTMIYLYIPNRKVGWKSQIPGAVLAATVWIAMTRAFAFYLSWETGGSSMYGSLTTLIVFLTWLYFCMWILLIGAEVNTYYERRLRMIHQSAKELLENHRDRHV